MCGGVFCYFMHSEFIGTKLNLLFRGREYKEKKFVFTRKKRLNLGIFPHEQSVVPPATTKPQWLTRLSAHFLLMLVSIICFAYLIFKVRSKTSQSFISCNNKPYFLILIERGRASFACVAVLSVGTMAVFAVIFSIFRS